MAYILGAWVYWDVAVFLTTPEGIRDKNGNTVS